MNRARRAGVTTVWTGTCSATVELARLAGPDDRALPASTSAPVRLPGDGPWRLAMPQVRAAIYAYCLTLGTQFDIYRWVNLSGLAEVWPLITLPAGVRSEWRRVLVAAGLIAKAA